jgi:hypothetical protein
MRATDRAIGIAIGIMVGIAIVAAFVFLGSGSTIDDPSLSDDEPEATQTQPPTVPGEQP